MVAGLTSCSHEPWQVEMTSRLDSMIVLSESHLSVIQSIDTAKLRIQYDTLSTYKHFFGEYGMRGDTPVFERSVYTGPLYEMEWCEKYYGRVLGEYAMLAQPVFNVEQLKSLRKDVNGGLLDSAEAVGYFNTEATALHSDDRLIQKSYGGCFACLRTHDSLVNILDSLRQVILADDAE